VILDVAALTLGRVLQLALGGIEGIAQRDIRIRMSNRLPFSWRRCGASITMRQPINRSRKRLSFSASFLTRASMASEVAMPLNTMSSILCTLASFFVGTVGAAS